ncbi:hypothetical protein D9757_008178 [Collybiopsis confluens]|uniref:Synaptobrevin homolog YKT6 n=1 Tax=Collybiopsis confluens TaxID=2823264 RepID=A0A8H5HE73_9AGAR|nr:hypothetical protein D9757_008178 [Collybiopsis confluens]
MAERTPQGQRQSVQENNYTAHVYNRGGAEQLADQEYPVRPAFSILTKILDDFITKVPQSSFSNPSAISFPDIQTYVSKYQDPHQADTIMRVQRELDETKIILHKTIESVLERGEKLDNLVDRSTALSAQSKMFYKTAKKHLRMLRKKKKNMTSTSSQILSIAPYHQTLLQTLDSLQYAPSALTQQTSYLSDLESQLSQLTQTVHALSLKTKKERKEHEEIRNSTAKRLVAKLGGKGKVEKYEAKKEKEEREYVDALEGEMRERGTMEMLEAMVREAKRVKSDLEHKSRQLSQTKIDINNLYRQVFDGPTVEFPRDDVLERELGVAQETYDRVQAVLNTHSQAVRLLGQADQMMGGALKKMDEALGYSTWDVYGGGSLADMMERDALANAAVYAAKAEMLIRQAQRTSSDVQSIGSLRVQDISLLGDVFFDNIFSDIRAHHKIKNNRTELAAAHGRLKAQLRPARQRAQLAGADLVEASEVLAECNRALDIYRREVFLRIGGGGGGAGGERGEGVDEALPMYGETSGTTSVPVPVIVERTTTTNIAADADADTPPPAFEPYAPPPGPPPSGPSSLYGLPSPPVRDEDDRTTRTRMRIRMPEPEHPSSSSSSYPSNDTPSLRSRSSVAAPTTIMPAAAMTSDPFDGLNGLNLFDGDRSQLGGGGGGGGGGPGGNGLRRSRSSISSGGGGVTPTFSSPSLGRDKALPRAPQTQIRYPPPPGPPPPLTGSATAPTTPVRSNFESNSSASSIMMTAAAGNVDTNTNADDREGNSGRTKRVVPGHWGNKNPFAAMMMIG